MPTRVCQALISNILQCPYLIYVEVLDTQDILAAPVPVRIPESQLRSCHSDEDILCPPSPTPYEEPPLRTLLPAVISGDSGDLIDDQDCWSQDDDDIITVSHICHITVIKKA